jgi:hypothetical protein
MNIVDIHNGLKAGTFKVDLKGHCSDSVEERIKQEIRHINDMIAQYTNGKDASKKDRMLKHYKDSLTNDYNPGDYLGFSGMERQCFDCGSRMYIVLQDENTLTVVPTSAYWDIREKGGEREKINKYDYVIKPHEIPACEAMSLRKKKKLVSEIEVPTGELIFQNYFEKEHLYCDPKNKHGHPDINSVLGRNVLMQYLATQNVGYGQMGNMSVAVFVRKDGTEIIVSKRDSYDDKGDYEVDFVGFDFLGEISLSVWRWQCADKSVLTANDEPIITTDDRRRTYHDAIHAKVKRGKWKIEHYFDFMRDDDKGNPIYSRLKWMGSN